MAGIDEWLGQPRPDAVKTVNYFPTGPWIRPAPQLTASRAGVTTRLGARCHFRPHGGSNAPGKQTTMTRVASRAPGVPRRFNPTPQVAVALAVLPEVIHHLFEGGAMRKRLTFANITSFLALFVALSASSYAATMLPANSVGTQQLKANAVTHRKIAARATLARR